MLVVLCDTNCVVLSVPLGMSLGWDVDFQSNTMISYFYLTPPPPPPTPLFLVSRIDFLVN